MILIIKMCIKHPCDLIGAVLYTAYKLPP